MTPEQISEINALFKKYAKSFLRVEEARLMSKEKSDELKKLSFDELWQGPVVKDTMKILGKSTIHAIILMMASCTVQQGSKEKTYPTGVVEKSSHLYASLGSKAKGLTNSPEESSILELDDSISARNAATLVGSMYSAYALLGAQKSNNALEAGQTAQAARTDRTQIVSGASVEKAKINAEVAKEALKLQP